MIYEVSYLNERGELLLQATFAADGPKDAMLTMMQVPTLQPPVGTTNIEVRRLEEDPPAAA